MSKSFDHRFSIIYINGGENRIWCLRVVLLIEGVIVKVAGDDPSLHIPPDGDAGFAFFRGAFFAVVFEFSVAADGDDGVFF